MSNFSPKLNEATNEQLNDWLNDIHPQYGSLASDEQTRRVINDLKKTIEIFNDQSSKQTQKMIVLTWWIVVLTIMMLFGLLIQILISF